MDRLLQAAVADDRRSSINLSLVMIDQQHQEQQEKTANVTSASSSSSLRKNMRRQRNKHQQQQQQEKVNDDNYSCLCLDRRKPKTTRGKNKFYQHQHQYDEKSSFSSLSESTTQATSCSFMKMKQLSRRRIINSKSSPNSITTFNYYYLLQLALILPQLLLLLLLILPQNLAILPTLAQQPTRSAATFNSNSRLPDLTSSTSDEPIVAIVGQDAFLSCVAKNLQNYTIIWRYTNEASAPGISNGLASGDNKQQSSSAATQDSAQQTTTTPTPSSPLDSTSGGDAALGTILTAARQRVIGDDRFSIIQSHDTWLLKISNVRLSDTGTYICHTNSEPKVRALRILSVIQAAGSSSNRLAANGGQDVVDVLDPKVKHFSEIDYNFTDCCRAEYVVPRCQRLCSFQQLASRYQSINIVHECYSALPSISRCMVAGRNVTDCCQKRHIPDKCKPMCGHQGDTSAMSVQDQSYCADYSASIMSCVAEGISNLPGQPELVIVEAVSSSTLKVSWQKVSDENELKKIDGWMINLTKLSSFEDSIVSSSAAGATPNNNNEQSTTPASLPAAAAAAGITIVDVLNNSSLAAMKKLLAASSTPTSTISLKLDKSANEFSIENLKPYTVYQIQMYAFNSLGKSQLTDPIRALTLAPESELSSSSAAAATTAEQDGEAYVEPTLPDTRKCCVDRGVTLRRCLDTLCDPVEADRATIADLMICAPWSNITFSCLSSRVNHTDCCKARNVSPFCLSMCSGEVKRVDYRHFRCLTHMSSYTNCILESHNVLPSAPLNFTVGPITHTWAVLNWRPPRKHARSLQGYRIYWRRLLDKPQKQQQQQQSSGNSNVNNNNSPLARPINQPASSSTSSPMSSNPFGGGDSGGGSLDDEYLFSSAEAATNPYLLDALQPESVYETFVVAVNKFGQSDSSARFIFQTLADPERLAKLQELKSMAGQTSALDSSTGGGEVSARLPLQANQASGGYNETSCCVSGGVHSNCLQLCDYQMKVSDVASLITNCNTQMPVILRCMAGSRNSVPCCRQRRVADHCLNVCAGLSEHSPLVVATRCAADFGKIIRCMDEGSQQIPSAPLDLHTTDIKSNQLTLQWKPAREDSLRSDVEYHVRYQQLQQQPASDSESSSSSSTTADLSTLIAVVPLHPLEHNLVQTTNKTSAALEKLKPNTRYSIYVTSENPYGISLPSLVLVIQTPPAEGATDNDDGNYDQYKRRATLGAPHSLEILKSDTESIVLKWIAPLFINNDAQIKYRVFYKLISSSSQQQQTNNDSSSSSTTTTTTTTSNETSAAVPAPVQQVASNWTVIETSDTSLMLRNLRYSSQYVITVQAYSKQMLGHMSEILLASTAKPVPPTLNHPLVINQPIEGNNITIMCVALGQPTPQISMFINGLLVQKRTQPYVIYHLVNLVRGQLTITCFASNGHGKDYVSVQSRTEVSIKFPPKAQAKVRLVRAQTQSIARLTCEISGNPQPTVVWTRSPLSSGGTSDADQASSSSSTSSVVVTPNERISTLLVSQFDSPFTWTHTLTIRNVSQADYGHYQCRSKNILAEASDFIQLQATPLASNTNREPSSSSRGGNGATQLAPLKQLEQQSDLMDCCRSQNVSAGCLPVCSNDGLDVEGAFKTAECQPHLEKLMFCAADGSDHRNCCRMRQVPTSCLRWCSGAKLNIPALCFLSSALDINQCFQEGRALLPGPPKNVRVLLASESEHNTGDQSADGSQSSGSSAAGMEVVTTSTSTMLLPTPALSMFDSSNNNNRNQQQTSNENSDTSSSSSTNLNSNSNNHPSVISTMAMMMGDHGMPMSSNDQMSSSSSTQGGGNNAGAADQQASVSEPLIIEWDPPAKNPSLVQYYRIFWRPFGSRELSRTITNLTWIKLNDLSMNKIYEFVVKAANTHGSSVYSEPLTVKPAEIMASENSIGTASGFIWFMPSYGAGGSILSRVVGAICFATIFMFCSFGLVMLLERRGYLKRFASSKSNSSRISFANPAYLKDSDNANGDGDNITWNAGHSLDILSQPPTTTLPPPPEQIPPTTTPNTPTTPSTPIIPLI